MKKILSCAFLALTVSSFVACSDAENDTYYASIRAKNGAPVSELVLYADQTKDTLSILSTDAWTATGADWFTVTPGSFTPQNPNTGYLVPIAISTTPNTTGKARAGLVTAHVREDISLPVYQAAWLNIRTPFNAGDGEFNLVVSNSDSVATNMDFTTYSPSATLTSDAAWVTFSESTFKEGAHKPQVFIGKNTTNAARTATITLTSAGVSTKINVRQPAPKNP